MDNNKVIVFDLDGTLYEDTHHFDYYAKRLKEKLPLHIQDQFSRDYENAYHGNHTLKIGRVYDVARKLILIQENRRAKEAFTWDGTSLSKKEVSLLYPHPLDFDFKTMVSVGDLWLVPSSIARYYGLDELSVSQSFFETREYMMGPDFTMTPIKGFKQALESVKYAGHKLVLLTNSPEEDSEVILVKLGLDQLFDKKIFEGRKPTRTKERFTEIKTHFQVDFNEILSVGDNWINEILPAKELGCQTILIDPHEIGNEAYADKVVRSISNVIPILHEMAN